MHSENISISAALLLAWERAFPRLKAICEAWERCRMAEIAGLGTAFPCVPAYFSTTARSLRTALSHIKLYPVAVWLGGRVVRTLDLR